MSRPSSTEWRELSMGPWARPGYPGSLDVPGAITNWANNPWSRADRAVPIAVVHEHRFAFAYWNKWRRGLQVRPTLLTIDWHADTGSNGDDLLDAVNLDDDSEVALFCWSQLSPNNDGQICAAAWLDVIGDVVVLCKQDDPDAYDYRTRSGSSCFTIVRDRAEFLCRAIEIDCPVILDIDLDYFTSSDDPSGGGPSATLALDGMGDLLRPDGSLLTAIGPRLLGLTIATEAEFCGGFQASAEILAGLDDTMFAGTLGGSEARWATRQGEG